VLARQQISVQRARPPARRSPRFARPCNVSRPGSTVRPAAPASPLILLTRLAGAWRRGHSSSPAAPSGSARGAINFSPAPPPSPLARPTPQTLSSPHLPLKRVPPKQVAGLHSARAPLFGGWRAWGAQPPAPGGRCHEASSPPAPACVVRPCRRLAYLCILGPTSSFRRRQRRSNSNCILSVNRIGA
jgi:hypothetical protein